MHIYPEWLLGDDLPMVPVREMTIPAQHAAHNGPGSERLPGYVVIEPGGPWFTDEDDEWNADRTAKRTKR